MKRVLIALLALLSAVAVLRWALGADYTQRDGIAAAVGLLVTWTALEWRDRRRRAQAVLGRRLDAPLSRR